MPKSPIAVCLAASFLIGCAVTPEASLARAQKQIAKAPFEDRPVLFDVYEQKGVITAAVKQEWLKEWNETKKRRDADRAAAEKAIREAAAKEEKELRRVAAERKRMWDSLTPAQKIDFEMRARQMAQQQDLANQQIEAQRRAMITNYLLQQQSTQQPINVNVHSYPPANSPYNYFIPAR